VAEVVEEVTTPFIHDVDNLLS